MGSLLATESAASSFRVPETNLSTTQPAAEQTVPRINHRQSSIKICRRHPILRIKLKIGFQIIQIINQRIKQ